MKKKISWPTLKKILITVLTLTLGFLSGERTADYMNERCAQQSQKSWSSVSLDGSQDFMQHCVTSLNGPEV